MIQQIHFWVFIQRKQTHYLKKNLHSQVHSSVVYSSQEMKDMASLVTQLVKNLPAIWETQVWPLGWEDPLEKALESPLACKEIRLVNPKGNQSWIFTGSVRGVCNVLSSILSKIRSNGWTSVTAQFYFASKRKYFLKVWGWADPKDMKRREAHGSILAPVFIWFFLLLLSLPCVNWAIQEGCLFYLSFSVWSSDLPLFYFCGLFLFCLLASTILDSFFLF